MPVYKSHVKEIKDEFVDYLKAHVDTDEARYAWNFYKKHLYIDDLSTYLKLKLSGAVVDAGFGDYNASIAIVLPSMKDKQYLDFFRPLFQKLNMDFNDFYFTSYHKCENAPREVLDETIALELKTIGASMTYTIGDYGVDQSVCPITVLDKEVFDKIIFFSNAKDVTEAEKLEAESLKKTLWSQLRTIINFYSV